MFSLEVNQPMGHQAEVPPHFLCPISMDLMTDPVTVISGITYDRHSIETWLFSAKNTHTCPVTKRNLSGTNLTPNHTLRRLIQAWCTLHAFDRIPTPKPPIDRAHIAKLLSDATAILQQQQQQPQPQQQLLQCLHKLKTLALESHWNRRCLEEAGVIEFLALVMRKGIIFKSHDVENLPELSNEGDEALSLLYHMETSEAGLKKLVNDGGGLVESLVQVLSHGKFQSRAYAILILKSLFEVADPVRVMSAGSVLFQQVVRVLADRVSFQSTKAALKLLAELCPWGRNRVKAVEAGSVHALVETLLHCGTAASPERRSCELALVVLDQLCSCAEGRAELLKHGAGVAVVSKKILRVSHAASDRAVRILSSMSRFSGTTRVVQEMLHVGAVSKMCLVMQVESSGMKSKERCREILRLHSRAWKSSPCIPPHLLSSYP